MKKISGEQSLKESKLGWVKYNQSGQYGEKSSQRKKTTHFVAINVLGIKISRNYKQ